jgi:hypothetical protein
MISLLTEVKHGPRGGKKANTSPLMKAIESAQENEPVNGCPFGCADEDLDERNYCRHMVGVTPTRTTPPGVGDPYEPVVREEGQPPRLNGRKPQKIREGDVSLRITTSYRVYRPDPPEKKA